MEKDIIDSWQDWTDEVVTARHRCPQNDHTDVGVLRREASAPSRDGWILANMEIATEEDVRGGRAPRIGDVERCIAIQIFFCPFCGSSLD
jgi:hypothetical protein